MNLKQTLHDIGLGDGEGNTSSTRIILFIVTLCWLVSKFYNAHLTHAAITWDSSDMEVLGIIGGLGVVKTQVEKPSTKTNTLETSTTVTAAK